MTIPIERASQPRESIRQSSCFFALSQRRAQLGALAQLNQAALGNGPSEYCEDILLANNVFCAPEVGLVAYIQDAARLDGAAVPNPTALDFALQATSPAVDAGFPGSATIVLPATDYAGRTRSGAPDVGAFER